MTSPFAQDSFFVKNLVLSELRLFDHAILPWLILIPRREKIIELIELSWPDQTELLKEINLVSQLLKANFSCDKLNIATLGNVVPQLHVHVIARCKEDPYFPGPVFGSERIAYTPEAREARVAEIQGLLA